MKSQSKIRQDKSPVQNPSIKAWPKSPAHNYGQKSDLKWIGVVNLLLCKLNPYREYMLRDYVSNIWGNLWIAVMGAGQGVWPKIFFLVHMTMSTGPLASPPPRGGASWCLQIFACFLPVLSLALISCWSMLETCASVSGHHFSHIKSHFNDLKQNFKIWGYLQKRHF